MSYVRKIREIVAKMSPTDQRLFNLKFQFDFSDQDYRRWETISAQKHVKDPFAGSRQVRRQRRICQKENQPYQSLYRKETKRGWVHTGELSAANVNAAHDGIPASKKSGSSV